MTQGGHLIWSMSTWTPTNWDCEARLGPCEQLPEVWLETGLRAPSTPLMGQGVLWQGRRRVSFTPASWEAQLFFHGEQQPSVKLRTLDPDQKASGNGPSER